MTHLTPLASSGLDLTAFGGALIVMGLAILAGRLVRLNCKPLQALFLPTSVVAGVLAMLLGPQVFGALAAKVLGPDALLAGGIIPSWVMDAWAELPKVLITVVFAGLLLGKSIPAPREIWRQSGPQVMFGYTLAFGQYAIGFALVLAVLGPVFGIDPMAGALIEIAFTGGHGTAAGLGPTFEQVGYEEGRDLALGLATLGVVMGVVLGTIFINIGVRSPRIAVARTEETRPEEDYDIHQMERNDHEEPGEEERDDSAADPLTKNLALIGVAIGIGWLLKEGLVLLEALTWGRAMDDPLMPLVPLFPMAMIGGAALQVALMKTGRESMVDRRVVNRIGGTSLDVIIVAAMATMALDVLATNFWAFLVLGGAAIAWVVFAFWVLAPRMLPVRWFERGLGDFGQSAGMAVTGLLLMRIADPRNRTGAIEGFGYKQLLFEPVVGGGLVTALSVPFAARFGAGPMFIATAFVAGACLMGGLMLARRIRRAAEP